MAKNIWKFLAWLFIADGLIAYNLGWYALLSKRVFWGVPNEFWFYDAVASGIFGIFFLTHLNSPDKEKMR